MVHFIIYTSTFPALSVLCEQGLSDSSFSPAASEKTVTEGFLL